VLDLCFKKCLSHRNFMSDIIVNIMMILENPVHTSRDRSVGEVNGYKLDDGVRFQAGTEFLS
jgi:hypothetical protein